MNVKEEEEIKKEFQLERVVLFTDAVFAIILTIMVLEIKLPEGLRHAPEESVLEAFKEIIFKFLAYLISFGFVAKYWMSHLKLFRYLKDYDNKLIVLNLFFLFCVSLFPFAVSLLSGTVSVNLPEYGWGVAIYISVIYMSLFAQALVARHLVKNKSTLCIHNPNMEHALKWKVQQVNLYLTPVVVLLTVIFVSLSIPYQFFTIIFAGYAIVISRTVKKHYPGEGGGPIIARLFQQLNVKRVKQ